MVEDPNNPRLWLVTGVRYCDVKADISDYLTALKEGTILQVFAACCEEGAFKNLRVMDNWKGENVNVGVISSKMRDLAATYMDDEGYMEVRVVEGRIGDKDFWVEPVLEAPLRPIAQRSTLMPLPFSENLVPFRTNEEACRSTATRQLVTLMQSIEDNITAWTWTELRNRTLLLAEKLHDYPRYCLHSLCEEEDKMLRGIIGRLREIIMRLEQVSGMADCIKRLTTEYEIIEQLEHDYSSQDVCARIYKEEMAEIEKVAQGPCGMLTQFFGQLCLENNVEELTVDILKSALGDINAWLKGFMNGWYVRTKHSAARLAATIRCEHYTRRELYGYYCCEIIAKALKNAIKEKTIAPDTSLQPSAAIPPLVVMSQSKDDPADTELDPYKIIIDHLDKQRVVETVKKVAANICDEPYKFAHLMKVMIDHRIIMAQQSEQAKFSKALAHWLMDNGYEADKLKGCIRQRYAKIMESLNLKSPQVLPYYWTWPDTNPDKHICYQIGAIFEESGFLKPRKMII